MLRLILAGVIVSVGVISVSQTQSAQTVIVPPTWQQIVREHLAACEPRPTVMSQYPETELQSESQRLRHRADLAERCELATERLRQLVGIR